jgi:hypothetical protein
MEIAMLGNDHSAARCSNGLTAQTYRESSADERATYRRWLRGLVMLYGALLLLSGAVAVASYSGAGLTQITKLNAPQGAALPRTD